MRKLDFKKWKAYFLIGFFALGMSLVFNETNADCISKSGQQNDGHCYGQENKACTDDFYWWESANCNLPGG